MTLLRYADINKIDKKQREDKIKELYFERMKAGVTANKTSSKTKEIKKAIARLLTYERLNARQEQLKKQKKP